MGGQAVSNAKSKLNEFAFTFAVVEIQTPEKRITLASLKVKGCGIALFKPTETLGDTYRHKWRFGIG